MNTIKKIALATSLVFASETLLATPITTQIITIMDESGSMAGEQAWIDDAMIELDASLLALAGSSLYDGTFGLVGYGSTFSAGNPRKFLVGGNDLGTVTEFATATTNLIASGRTEDGWEAIDFVFDNYNVGNALTTIFLVTDEDRDNTSSDTYQSVLNQLTSTSTLLNSVVPCTFFDTNGNIVLGIDANNIAYSVDSSGGFVQSTGNVAATSCLDSSKTDYVDMSFASGGSAWNISLLRNNPAAFTTGFVNSSSQIIVSQNPGGGAIGGSGTVNVSAPASLGVIGLGFLALLRRRVNKTR